MCRARPSTTVWVTLTSGWSDVPDFSAYLRAYAHILSTLALDGSLMCLSLPLRQRGVDRFRIEARQPLVTDQDDRQRQQPQLHELLTRRRVLADVALRERHALLRQILCRSVTRPSADVGVDGDGWRHVLSLCGAEIKPA